MRGGKGNNNRRKDEGMGKYDDKEKDEVRGWINIKTTNICIA